MGRGFNESGKKSAGLSSTTLSTDRLEADRLECPQPSRTSRQNGMRRPAEREEGHVLFHRVPFPSDATFSRTKKKTGAVVVETLGSHWPNSFLGIEGTSLRL